MGLNWQNADIAVKAKIGSIDAGSILSCAEAEFRLWDDHFSKLDDGRFG